MTATCAGLFSLSASLVLSTAAHGSDHVALQKEFDRRIIEEIKNPPTNVRTIPLPPVIAGTPEYAVRVIFLMPTDRSPADPGDHADRVDEATIKIRCALEAISDFYASEQELAGVSVTGKPVNFERELDGQIRVIALDGTKATEGAAGYWGDTTGLNGGNVYFNALIDIFGSTTNAQLACEKTAFIIFPDTLRMEDTGGGTVAFRGYLGLGSSAGTNGYGGFGMMAYGMLDSLIDPTGPTEPERLSALADTFCSTDTSMTIGSYTGNFPGAPPACAANRDLMRGEVASIYLGVLAHETLHGFRIGHDGYTPGGVMGSGYPRIAETFRTMYSFPSCPSVPILNPPNCTTTVLGNYFSLFVSQNPYFNVLADPDKSDPGIDVAWPPNGHFYRIEAAQEALPYLIAAIGDPGVGTPMSLALYYYSGTAVDDVLFAGGTRAVGEHNDWFFDKFVGRRIFTQAITDSAGNITEQDATVFGMIYTTAEMGTLWGNNRWVRRPPGEDDRPRNAGAPLGTFHNPYSDIQTAIEVVRGLGSGTVMIGEGVWPISTPLFSGRNINVTGEGVGQTILDGGGTATSIFIDDTGASRFEECAISNLVLRNAAAGIRKTNANPSYNYSITNCIFYDIAGTALDLPVNRGRVDVSGHTIVDCGNGIRMTNYQPFVPADRFYFRNNLVSNCTTDGIRLDSIQGLYTSRYTGYNLSTGSTTDFVGSGDGSTAYASNRLPGELSSSALFLAYPPVNVNDMRLRGDSPARQTGQPTTENEDGSRRDIGAFLGTPPDAAVAEWTEYSF
jgi:hypothetical protein